jgi:hypothetical protein
MLLLLALLFNLSISLNGSFGFLPSNHHCTGWAQPEAEDFKTSFSAAG